MFKAKSKELKPGYNCRDFKPLFMNRNYCKLSWKCNAKEQGYIIDMDYCTGIKHESELRVETPPQGGIGIPNK